MPLTRRAALAALATGVSSSPTAIGRARAEQRRGSEGHVRPPKDGDDAQSDGGGHRLAWDLAENGEFGWYCLAAARGPAGGVVAACNLVEEAEIGPAARLVSVDPDGSTEAFATVGDPESETRELVTSLVPAVDGGYVVGGIRLPDGDSGPGYEAVLRRVTAEGTTEWERSPPEVDPQSGFPEPVAAVRAHGGYVIALGDRVSRTGSGFAGIGSDGDVRWTHTYDPGDEIQVELVGLATHGDGVVALGAKRSDGGNSTPPRPVLVEFDAEGSVRERAEPAVDGGRVPFDLSATDDRLLVVGTVADETGSFRDQGWAMELDGVVEEPNWSRAGDSFGTQLAAVGDPETWDGGFAAGSIDSGRAVYVDPSPPSTGWSESVDGSGTFHTVLERGDGSVYAIGTDDSAGGDATLQVVRVSAPLRPNALSATVDPAEPRTDQPTTLAIDPGPYDPSLLDVTWTVNGTEVATGTDASVTFDSAGSRTVTFAVATEDGRTASVEREVTVRDPGAGADAAGSGESGGDGLPGFGVGLAALGLAGGVELRSRWSAEEGPRPADGEP